MSGSLTNIFNPKPATLDDQTLWVGRGKDITVSLGFTGKDVRERLERLDLWLSQAQREVSRELAALDRIPLATSRPLDTSRREADA